MKLKVGVIILGGIIIGNLNIFGTPAIRFVLLVEKNF